MSENIHKYKGKVAFCFLTVRSLKNQKVWENFFRGYEKYITIYAHISGQNYNKGPSFFGNILWDNKVEEHGLKHVDTKWGEVSLVVAEGLLYKAALKDKANKYFCLCSESDIPLWSFPEFYNRLNTRNKSYMVVDSGRGDESIFLECFPEKFIPSSNRAKRKEERDYRKILTKTSHQWKILVRKEAKDFVEMISKRPRYIEAYDKCFEKNPERLAPDEYSFVNWLTLKYKDPKYVNKRIINTETTAVDFDSKAIHAKEFSHISNGLKKYFCEDKPFFARKFDMNKYILGQRLLKEVPLKCEKKSRKARKSIKSGRIRKSIRSRRIRKSIKSRRIRKSIKSRRIRKSIKSRRIRKSIKSRKSRK